MQHEPKKIALFVDFDNIYLGLRETSREAAEAFATKPNSWLRWIEQGMPLDPDADRNGPKENRVLIRRCYLNPDTFGKYRGWFTHSGFTVVDCPSLTSRGKNSSDIVMVMDILDALRHETRFDRFVIMSADADFTPVLQRLRAHDRRTAVLVSGQAAPAYRAACDRLITEDQFIELALEMPAIPEPPRTAAPAFASASSSTAAAPSSAPAMTAAVRDPELLAAIGRRVYEEASSSGTLSASELPRILREFKEFTPTSNWLGYFSLQSLAEAVLAHRPELRITDDDPWRIAVQVADEPAPAAGSAPASAPAQQPGAEWPAIRDRVVGLVARMVAEAAEPVVMGKAAHAAIQEAGPLITETRWLGKGTFKNLLLSAPDLPFRVVASPLPGYLYDPARHPEPGERTAADGLAELGGEMASLIRRIHQLTDAPKLTPRQYRVLFEVIAKEITRAPYSLMSTGKAVRDQCVERGEPIARQGITQVLRGLSYGGYKFWDPPHRPDNLAYTYRGNLINLLRQAQVTLSDDELRMLDDWLLGPIADESHEPPPVASGVDARDAGPPSADPATVPAMDEAPAADPSGDSDAPSAAEPVEAIEPDFASADALPADESHDADSAERDVVSAEWHPADESAAPATEPSAAAEPASASADDVLPVAETAPQTENAGSVDERTPHSSPAEAPPVAAADADPELADAIPVELSDDHGPAGPDVVTAEWQMSDEPPSAEASDAVSPPSEAPSDEPAEPPPASEAPSDEIVSAEWQPADAPSASDAPADPAASAEPVQSEAPAEPTPASEAPSDEAVFAEWQPADAPPATDAPVDQPAAAAPDAPATEAPAADSSGTGAIFTPFWEVADEDATAAAPQPAVPSAPADAPSDPATQRDAFPANPPSDGNEPGAPEPAPADADPSQDDQPAQQPLWWQ